MRIALVHEWLDAPAGSEKTFLRMASLLPTADLFALTVSPQMTGLPTERPVRTTVLQKLHVLRQRRSITLPLMPLAWATLPRLGEYDLVVTSSHAFSRYFPAQSNVCLSYVYTPLRFAWFPEIDGRGEHGLLSPARSLLRWLDRRSVPRVQAFAGISTEVVDRVQACYGREARRIFPPVDVTRFESLDERPRGDFLLGFSRWVPYKRLDLVIELGERLGLPVVIAGSGPQEQRLAELAQRARVPVELVRRPSDERVAELLLTCRALVFPAYEDFGIVPVEAQACGTPVIALGRGGARDTVIEGRTGALSPTPALDDLVAAAERCFALGDVSAACRANAGRFSTAHFDSAFLEWIAVETGAEFPVGAGQLL